MALINLHQDPLLHPRLPIYMSPRLLPMHAHTQSLFSCETSSFENKFHHEIINLQERRQLLSKKLAQAKNAPQTPASRQEILKEYSALEGAKKWLALIADATEKSRQSMAANLR